METDPPVDTEGNEPNVGGGSFGDDDTDTLWGWLDGVVSGLETVWKAITDLPMLIGIKLREIFVPDTSDIEATFQNGIDTISAKFGFPEFDLNALADSSVRPDDITGDYDIPGVGTLNLTFFDSSFLIHGIEFFRPFIRGFLVLLLVFYHWRQWLSFIGHDLGYVGGQVASHSKRGK